MAIGRSGHIQWEGGETALDSTGMNGGVGESTTGGWMSAGETERSRHCVSLSTQNENVDSGQDNTFFICLPKGTFGGLMFALPVIQEVSWS